MANDNPTENHLDAQDALILGLGRQLREILEEGDRLIESRITLRDHNPDATVGRSLELDVRDRDLRARYGALQRAISALDARSTEAANLQLDCLDWLETMDNEGQIEDASSARRRIYRSLRRVFEIRVQQEGENAALGQARRAADE